MKIKELIKLLKKEDQNAEIFIYLGSKKGWAIEQIGYGDAIIGRSRSKENDFILIPVEIPDKLEKWADQEKGFEYQNSYDDEIIGKA